MENSGNRQPQEEQEIDLLELVKKLWKRRKLFYKTLGISIVVGLIIAFSIPREYRVTVKLAPESTKRTSSLASAAAMLGISSLSSSNESDALNVTLFPDILASTPFALDLYYMPVKMINRKDSILFNQYIETKVKHPWWNIVLGLPSKLKNSIISIFSSSPKEDLQNDKLDPFKLTFQETGKLSAIKSAIQANVDKKTGITTINVTLQDPMVAAIVADSVVVKLQDYVTTYRTQKTAVDCAYWEKLYNENKIEFYQAQQEYAKYIDENKNLFTQKSKIEGERLQNEMNLTFQMYNQTATQLQLARGKLQEAKPVFAVVEPATVPLKPIAPKKIFILATCLFLAFAGTAGWILFGEDIWKKLKNNAIN